MLEVGCKMKRILSFVCHLSFGVAVLLVLAGCSSDSDETVRPKGGVLKLTTSVEPFDGEVRTRTNLDGTAFATGDKMKLKIICPFTERYEFGETTNSNSADGLWVLKWNDGNWANITSADGVDVAGTYQPSSGYNLFGQYEAQQTPYVYTASTWNENVVFIANGSMYSQYSYIFQADQTDEEDYLKSDLLWAQSYMQTGSYNVHLSFKHMMACLKITVSSLQLSEKAVMTLEGMPDIDQREVVVGDYYAAKSKINSGYGYKQKCSCTKDDNGKVLGVVYINESGSVAEVHPMTGNPDNGKTKVANGGVYTAHRYGNEFYLIVPPCTLSTAATFWIRDGEQRYSYTLELLTFDQGKQYRVTL